MARKKQELYIPKWVACIIMAGLFLPLIPQALLLLLEFNFQEDWSFLIDVSIAALFGYYWKF